MLQDIQILTLSAQRTAAIHLTIPRAEIQHVMGPGISELFQTLAAQGIQPAGPWLSRHFRMAPDVFDFEIALPVLTEVQPTGRVRPSALPAGRVARTIYRGPYEGLGQAWGEFRAQLTAAGHVAAEGLWEIYAVGPDSGLPSHDFQTELNQELVG